jgi:uncharacterized repeat protein (TIGR01451 family)
MTAGTSRVVGCGLLMVTVALGVVAPAAGAAPAGAAASGGSAAPSAAPTQSGNGTPLQVTVDTPQLTPREGERISYTVTVHNAGGKAYPKAVIDQLLPGGFTLVAAKPAAAVAGQDPEWVMSLPAGATQELTATVIAGRIPQIAKDGAIVVRQAGDAAAPARSGHQFSTTVCVRGDAKSEILACGSSRQGLQAAPPASASKGLPGWVMGLAEGGAAAVAAVGVVMLRRRRRSTGATPARRR